MRAFIKPYRNVDEVNVGIYFGLFLIENLAHFGRLTENKNSLPWDLQLIIFSI